MHVKIITNVYSCVDSYPYGQFTKESNDLYLVDEYSVLPQIRDINCPNKDYHECGDPLALFWVVTQQLPFKSHSMHLEMHILASLNALHVHEISTYSWTTLLFRNLMPLILINHGSLEV